MIFQKNSIVVFAISILFIISAIAADQDVRNKYGTRSLKAANEIARAIEFSNMQKHQEALSAINQAIKEDSVCQIAHFWKATILSDIGDMDNCINSYKEAVSLGAGRKSNITETAATNLAILMGKLKRYEEANLWFTRGILEDPENQFNDLWKAYRNMAITLLHQGDPYSAAMAAMFGYKYNPEKCKLSMVEDLLSRISDQEAGRILHFEYNIPEFKKRESQDLAPVELPLAITENISQLLADPGGKYVIAFPQDKSYFYLITTVGKINIKKVPRIENLLSVSMTAGELFGVVHKPPQIVKIDVGTGKALARYPLKDVAPTSFVVYPAHQLLILLIKIPFEA